jgi:hypothetical protein
MNILRNDSDKNILINNENDFKTDLGWQENAEELEKESLKRIINPIDNYETVRYIHEEYPISGVTNFTQNDIWFYFYFTTGTTYTNGLDYNLVGIQPDENAKLLKVATESFFRLEFYKTPNNDVPDRSNRKLVFTKNLTLPLGERYFFAPLIKNIFVPVFSGSNYRNKENMYLFWFKDDSAFEETLITGNTFWVSARFYNAKDGEILNLTNSGLTPTTEIVESRDMYYKLEINRTDTPGRTDYSYIVYSYSGSTGARVGTRYNPIKFYQSFS